MLLMRCQRVGSLCCQPGCAPVEPKIEEGLPRQLLWLQQSAHYLCLERQDLGCEVHHGDAAVLRCAEAGVLSWIQPRGCAAKDWPVRGDERVECSAQARLQLAGHWDEGGMVSHHGCEQLLGDVCPTQQAEPEARPACDLELHLPEDGCVEGGGGGFWLRGQRNAQVLHARPLCCECDSRGRIWTRKMAEAAQAESLGLVALQPRACRCTMEIHAGIQDDLCVAGALCVDAGVVCVLMQDGCWVSRRQPDGLEGLLLSATPGVCCHRLRGEHKEQWRERASLEDS